MAAALQQSMQQHQPMTEDEQLAQALRDNLRRRKAQSREAVREEAAPPPPPDTPQT